MEAAVIEGGLRPERWKRETWLEGQQKQLHPANREAGGRRRVAQETWGWTRMHMICSASELQSRGGRPRRTARGRAQLSAQVVRRAGSGVRDGP